MAEQVSPLARATRAPDMALAAATREGAFRRARRHSGRVRFLKIVLPLLVLSMAALFILRASLTFPEGVRAEVGALALQEGRLVMDSPRLDGFTRDNRPYSLEAARAVQDVGNGNEIDLEGIRGRLPLEVENWAELEAESGTYDRAANSFHFNAPLTFRTDTGIVGRFKSAFVRIGEGELESRERVDIQLDGSRISADALLVSERGSVVVFENRVRVEIQPEAVRRSRD